MADLVNVQLCYAAPLREFFRELAVAPGTTIEQAILQSGVLQDMPGIDLATQWKLRAQLRETHRK